MGFLTVTTRNGRPGAELIANAGGIAQSSKPSITVVAPLLLERTTAGAGGMLKASAGQYAQRFGIVAGIPIVVPCAPGRVQNSLSLFEKMKEGT